ncbi:MAG: KUP/HAK/KT family potassium transporter [Wigglesworthia glossinidia]|nr:KUP/HAK/KT family potassium transporter [Wigglesworthia glossinidia]
MTIYNKKSFLSKIFLTIGIMYGEVAISPIYILKEILNFNLESKFDTSEILGALSLIFWSLIIIYFIKYLIFVTAINSNGEGGILTLMLLSGKKSGPRATLIIVIFGLLSFSLMCGDIITMPAISIMSVIEVVNLNIIKINNFILPISITLISCIFFIQRKIEKDYSKIFSFIIVIWFIFIGILGIHGIYMYPDILNALNPKYSIDFILKYKKTTFFTFGLIVLLISSAEILYINLGRFQHKSIQKFWLFLIFPTLILNYLGQGAVLLLNPNFLIHPFFFLIPKILIIPAIIMLFIISIISVQTIIRSVFSLIRQAVRLGYLPPIRIIYTSEESRQIYIPCINLLFYISIIIEIINFKNVHNLILMYGIGMISTMILTTCFSYFFFKKNFKKYRFFKLFLFILILILECSILSLMFIKIKYGSWISVISGLFLFIIMITWKSEKFNLLQKIYENSSSLQSFIKNLNNISFSRVNGTSVFMSKVENIIPLTLLHNISHNKILHKRIIFLTIKTEDIPFTNYESRVYVECLSHNFWKVVARYGFKEKPDIKEVFHFCELSGLSCQIMDSSFFLSYEILILDKRPWYLVLRAKLFMLLARNSLELIDKYGIPSDRIISLGMQIKI